MAPLGPFEPAPRLAVAVSGGADSLCLALLADAWARARGGCALALVVDHGLRAESAGEAALTLRRLAGLGIPGRLLPLEGLAPGPGLAARARAARHAALEAACADGGIVHLLLGHHSADQAETVALRHLAGSGAAGLAGMAVLTERSRLRLLRPLLGIAPARLRATLSEAGIGWVEDPSNRDTKATRNRIRAERGAADGQAELAAAIARGGARAADERAAASWLAERASLRPEGYALVTPGPLEPAPVAALLRTVAGRPHPPATAQLAAFCRAPRPVTLGGVRILPAGRLAPGAWLFAREEAAMAPPIPAAKGAVWDGRFRVLAAPPGLAIGGLGPDSARLRGLSPLPAAVLRTLPALRRDGLLLLAPHIGYDPAGVSAAVRIVFDPGQPVAPAPFLPLMRESAAWG
jgi:tRNA(Ile)-lysidine synthase